MLLEGALACTAGVSSFVVVHCGDVAQEAVLEGERFWADVARERLLLLVDAHDVLVEISTLPEGACALRTLVRLGVVT